MRKEKHLLLDEVKDQIERQPSFILMRYAGLSANKANDFRNEIAKLGGSVEMVRKRLLIKAAETMGISLTLDTLPGHISIIFGGKDPFETTKSVFKFGRENEKIVEVIGGRFEGQLYNAADVKALSELPSKNEMRAQFLGTLEAPMAQTLAVLEAILTSVPYCLDNKSKQM